MKRITSLFIVLMLQCIAVCGQTEQEYNKFEAMIALTIAEPTAYSYYPSTNWSTTQTLSNLVFTEISFGYHIHKRFKPYIVGQIQVKTFQNDPSIKIVTPQNQLGIGLQYHFLLLEKWRSSVLADAGYTKGFFDFIPQHAFYSQLRLETVYNFNHSGILIRLGGYHIKELNGTVINNIFVKRVDLGYAIKF